MQICFLCENFYNFLKILFPFQQDVIVRYDSTYSTYSQLFRAYLWFGGVCMSKEHSASRTVCYDQVMNTTFCSKLLLNSCKLVEKERREDVHPDLGRNLNHGPTELQLILLTTKLCPH